jgi:tetratricopeptide (TPR) repeat protein
VAASREVCLADRLTELDASIRVLAAADVPTVDNAVPAAFGLTPISECANLKAAPPADQEAAVAGVKADLARARALNGTGKYSEARDAALAARDAAERVDARALAARANFVLGSALANVGDAKEAEASMRRAAALADASADDRTRAQAWVVLIGQVGFEQRRFDEVPALDQQARSALERLGGDEVIDAHRRANMAIVLVGQDKYDDAALEIEGALAGRRAHLLPDDEDLGTTFLILATIRRHQRRYDEALAACREALDLYTRNRGSEAPLIALVLNDIADIHRHAGNAALAVESADRALAILRQLDPEHPRVSTVLGTRAEALLELGRYEDARRDASSALALAEKRFGADSVRLVPVLRALGDSYLGLDEPARAREVLERASALSNPTLEPADLANTSFALARALVATGGDRARAADLAQKAEADYAAAGNERARQAVATWRAKQRP